MGVHWFGFGRMQTNTILDTIYMSWSCNCARCLYYSIFPWTGDGNLLNGVMMSTFMKCYIGRRHLVRWDTNQICSRLALVLKNPLPLCLQKVRVRRVSATIVGMKVRPLRTCATTSIRVMSIFLPSRGNSRWAIRQRARTHSRLSAQFDNEHEKGCL